MYIYVIVEITKDPYESIEVYCYSNKKKAQEYFTKMTKDYPKSDFVIVKRTFEKWTPIFIGGLMEDKPVIHLDYKIHYMAIRFALVIGFVLGAICGGCIVFGIMYML